MADNSNGGQYQTSDPGQTTTGNVSITGSVTPTPDAQTPQTPPPAPAAPAAPQAQSPQQGPQQAPQGPQPNPQQPAAATPPPKPLTKTQSFLKRARDITDEMVGGDPYKTTIDPNTGETTRVRQPLSPRSIGISLALELLQGGIAGAGAHGPDAIGQAAQAGMKQGEQIADQRQQAQANQNEQAQTDLRNRQQVITNLLQTRQLAQTLGRQSLEMAQKSVEADSAAWQEHQSDPASIISQGVSHDDAYATLAKQPAGTAQVLMIGAHPRVDPKTGQPVYQLPNGQIVSEDTPGAYQAPNFTYAVVKSTAKNAITDGNRNLVPEIASKSKYGFAQIPKDADGKYPANFSVDAPAYQAMTRGNQIADALQGQINQERGTLGLEPIDISKDTAQDSTVRQALLMYNGVLGDSQGDHQKAYEKVLNSPYAGAAGTIQNWFGGKDAVRHLDQLRDSQNFDSDVLAGTHKITTLADASEAEASTNPRVQAAGKAARARINQDETAQRSRDAYASAGAEVWKEEKVAEVKARLAQQGGTNNPYFNETPDPTTGLKENYLNSLSDGQLIRNVIRGTAGDINLRTGKGIALAAEAANATNGRFNAEKYDGYRSLVKSITGKQGDYFSSGSTALDHLNAAYQSADRLSATPFISKIAQKGGFGSQAQNNAKQFDTDKKTASIEVGKAVEGGVLTNQDKDDWNAKVEHWTPEEFKAGARAMSDLIYQRMAEKREQLRQLAPAGIVTGLHGMSKSGVDSYNQMTGKGVKYEDQALDNDSSPSSQLANPIQSPPPQGAAGTMKFNGQTYYVDANKKPLARATQ